MTILKNNFVVTSIVLSLISLITLIALTARALQTVLSALLNALKAEYENVLPIKNLEEKLETHGYSSFIFEKYMEKQEVH